MLYLKHLIWRWLNSRNHCRRVKSALLNLCKIVRRVFIKHHLSNLYQWIIRMWPDLLLIKQEKHYSNPQITGQCFYEKGNKNGKSLGFHSLAPPRTSRCRKPRLNFRLMLYSRREDVASILLNCNVTLVRSNGFQRNFSASSNVMTWMYIVQDG